jgi:hypothetical protein
LPETKTLAYCKNPKITGVKSFTGLAQESIDFVAISWSAKAGGQGVRLKIK